MHVRTLVLTISLALVLLYALVRFARPSRYLSNCQFLSGKLPQDRLHTMARFVHPAETDADFIQASGGLKGVLVWLTYAATIVCLLQINVLKKTIPLSHAWDAYQDALAQFWYSLWAILEAGPALLWKRLSHPAARAAFEYHYALSLRASTLLGFDGAPACLLNNGRLL